jgi:hypothetical protein
VGSDVEGVVSKVKGGVAAVDGDVVVRTNEDHVFEDIAAASA